MGEKNIQIRPWIFLVIFNGIFNCGTIEKKKNIPLKGKYKKIVLGFTLNYDMWHYMID